MCPPMCAEKLSTLNKHNGKMIMGDVFVCSVHGSIVYDIIRGARIGVLFVRTIESIRAYAFCATSGKKRRRRSSGWFLRYTIYA